MKKITLLAFGLLMSLSSQAQISLESSTDYGKLMDVTYDPTIQNKLYALTQGNHIVVSTDNGLNWSVLYSSPDAQNFLSDLRLLPGNTSVSFATRTAIHIFDLATASVTASFPIPENGVVGAGPSYLSSYSVFDASGSVILVDTGFAFGLSNQGKTFITEDGGENWTELYYTVNNDNVFINNVAISPTNNKVLFLSRGLGDSGVNGGLWVSFDGGLSWNENLDGIAMDPIAFHPTNSLEILAGSSISFVLHPENLYKSTDGGTTWEIVPITWTEQTLDNITKIVYNAQNPNKIILLDENEIAKSEDGGATWQNNVYPVNIAMDYYYGINASYNPFNENQIAITTDFYPQFSNDNTPALVQIKVPFHNAVSTIVGKYATGNHLYYSAQGGRLHKDLTSGVTTAYNTELPNSFNPKKNYMIADPTVPGRLFTYASMGFFGGFLSVSNDYGATTTNILQGFADDMQELVVSPTNTNLIYVSLRSGEGGQLYKVDFNDLENIISEEIITPQINEFGEGVVTGVVINATNPDEMYIAKSNKVFKSTDAGVTWEEKINGLETVGTGNLIWDFVANPLHENQFTLSTNFGIFTTTDAAENWTQILDGVDVKRVKHSPIHDGVLVGAIHTTQVSEAGIVYSLDNGATWETISNASFDYIQTNNMDFIFEGNSIHAYIGSSDLGVIKYSITNLPLAINNPALGKNNFAMYPNPASNEVSLTVNGNSAIQSVTIFSLLGQKVMETNQSKIDVSKFTSGTYVVKVTTANGKTGVQKLIKK